MDIRRKLTVTLLDARGIRQGWIGNYLSCTATERYLAQSTGEITVEATDPMLPKMLAAGAQVQVTLDTRYDTSTPELYSPGHRVISGRLRSPRGSMMPNGTITFQIEGHWRLLRNTVARVVNGPLTAATLSSPGQSWNLGAPPPVGEDTGRSGYFAWPNPVLPREAAEFLIDQTLNQRWIERFGAPAVYFAGVGGIGSDIHDELPQVRFGTVEEYVAPILAAAGIDLRMVLENPTPGTNVPLRVGALFEEIRTWPQVFTPESGVLVGGEWSIQDQSVTDVVLGGPGELSARAFHGAAALAQSLEQHDIIEVFKDATGAPVEWPTTLDEKYRIAKYYLLRPEITADQKAAFTKFLDDAAAKTLAEGAATSGVSAKIAESEGFRYTGRDGDGHLPTGFSTGDIITVAPSAATGISDLRFTAPITETTLTQSRGQGLTVTPQVGVRKDDPDVQLALAIRDLAVANSRRSTTM